MSVETGRITTDIPARMDRLPGHQPITPSAPTDLFDETTVSTVARVPGI